MPNAKEVCNRVGKWTVKHSPELLVGLGITGMAGSIIFAWNQAPKAERIMKEERKAAEKEGNKYTKWNAVKDTVKFWAPPMAMFAISTACIVGASAENHKRNAALAAAYSLSEKTFMDYRTKVIEKIGTEASREIDTEIAKESAKEHAEESSTVIFAGNDDVLCFDDSTKQWFYSTKNKIENAAIKCNTRMINGMEMYCSLNEFIDEVNAPGFKNVGTGDETGWNINKNGAIEVDIQADVRDDGKPYLVLYHFNKPMYKYNEIY